MREKTKIKIQTTFQRKKTYSNHVELPDVRRAKQRSCVKPPAFLEGSMLCVCLSLSGGRRGGGKEGGGGHKRKGKVISELKEH